MIEVQVSGFELQLFPSGGAFWPARSTLLVADLHLGKATTFRRNGIPVPTGSSRGTLATVSRMLAESRARQLTILGDMFHSGSSLTADIREQLRALFEQHSDVSVTLVRGNHDAKLKFWDGWPVSVFDNVQVVDRVALAHHPQPLPANADLLVCGHIHPSIRLGDRTDRVGKLPCFYYRDNQLIMPAVGQFTGTHPIDPDPDDRVWVAAGDDLLSL